MELLERDRERETLETAIGESSSRGVVVVVEGEAGIGKTALVSAIALTHRVLWGACDPLITPRPMGPLRDVAREAGGPLAEAIEGSRDDLLSAVLDELRAPAALVIEDLHWADDATGRAGLLERGLEGRAFGVTLEELHVPIFAT